MKGTWASAGSSDHSTALESDRSSTESADLRQRDRRPRRVQRPAADLERAAREAGPQRIGDARRTTGPRPPAATSCGAGAAPCAACSGDSSSDSPEMVARPIPSDRLQKAVTVATSIAVSPAVTYRRKRMAAPVNDGEAQRMAEGIGDERGEQDARVGDRAPQIAQRQHLVGRQQPVAERGEQQRRQNLPLRDRVQMREHALDVQPCASWWCRMNPTASGSAAPRAARPSARSAAFLGLLGGRCRWRGQVRRRSASSASAACT